MNHSKFTAREDYRFRESRRTTASASLAEKFPELKSLIVEFGYLYVTGEGLCGNHQIKYTVNLDRAKSVFRLDCPNDECVGGDFDLSEVLARAVTARQTMVTSKICCQGWLSKTVIDNLHCDRVLRYTLSLEYEVFEPVDPNVVHAQAG